MQLWQKQNLMTLEKSIKYADIINKNMNGRKKNRVNDAK